MADRQKLLGALANADRRVSELGAAGALADHRLHGIAGRDVQEQKRHDEHPEERGDREQQTPADVDPHG
jgi:hypothetical protein